MWSKSIRQRVARALLIWSAVTAVLFAFATYWAADIMELLVLEQNLQATASRIKVALANNQQPEFPSEDWYWGGLETDLELPVQLRELPPGSHHDVMMQEREFHVWVDQVNAQRIYLVYDLAEIERYEARLVNFLLGCVLLLSIAALMLGHRGTAWVMRPLDELASRLRRLPVQADRFQAPQASDVDLAPMIAAIDDLLKRNQKLVEREARFTRIASHELRNPLASLQAALELAPRQTTLESVQDTVQRAARASQRMTEIVQVLLEFSRGESSAKAGPQSCDAAQVIAEEFQQIELATPPQLKLQPGVELPMAPGLFAILVGNLLRNAQRHGAGGAIALELSQHHLEMSNPLPEAGAISTAAPDRLGLGIVELLCGYQGWGFEHCMQDKRFVVRLDFSNRA